MTLPDARALQAAVAATWPAHRSQRCGPFTLRDGRGGGKRASAATAEGPVGPEDLATAEAAMRGMGMPPLFMVRDGETTLDTMLADAGYTKLDPTAIHAAALADLAMGAPAPTASFHLWEPLAIQREIWAEGGISHARVAVMMRAPGDKTALLGRMGGHAVAAGFAAIHERIAMVHALEVRPAARRRGAGRALMLEAARWAMARQARTLAVACTEANTAANTLYAAMGLTRVAHYHYRRHPQGGGAA